VDQKKGYLLIARNGNCHGAYFPVDFTTNLVSGIAHLMYPRASNLSISMFSDTCNSCSFSEVRARILHPYRKIIVYNFCPETIMDFQPNNNKNFFKFILPVLFMNVIPLYWWCSQILKFFKHSRVIYYS
jgi:hypothetical protein